MMRLRRWGLGCVAFAVGAMVAAANLNAQVPATAGAPANAGAQTSANPGGAAAPVAVPKTGPDVAADEAMTARLKTLETDLRCLVCQNQTLADSDAPLAADLRREVRELAVAGKSDDAIREYLTARYGDFVLYNPPVKRTTWVLWFGPFLLLAGGAIAWATILRRRGAAATDLPGDDQAAEARGRDRLQ